jgi:hypothetical protein
MDINVSSQIVVQTAAQWAADNTVYSAKRILVTSDVYYGSTDQRKFKIADGTQTWSNLDYMPIGQTLAQVLANGSSTNAVSFKSPDSLTELLVANNNIDAYVDNGSDVSEINITPTSVSISTTGTTPLTGVSLTANTVNIDSPTINLAQSTASRIVETDASKNLTYVAKGTAYNLNLGTTAGTVLEGNRITQVITNGVTDKAPSEDAVFDALALKRSSTYETLLFTGSFSSINLADSTTYYFGTLPSLPPQTNATLCRIGFNEDLTITKVILTCSQGVNYSKEAVSVYLRKDNTTDNTITTSLDLNSIGLNAARIFTYSVHIPVLSSSYYEFKIVTPAFGTNGTNSRWHIQLYGY